MKIVVEHINDIVLEPNWHGGGYCDGQCVYIESDLTPAQRRFTAYHELIEYYCRGRVRHAIIDKIVQELIGADRQLDMTLNCPDNKQEEDYV